jgi:hypothetical protein
MGLKIQRVESKRVDQFANMSDEELEAHVNGDRGLEHEDNREVAHSTWRVRFVNERSQAD